MKKALLVCEEFPFPPRNGVTIPICGFIELLSDYYVFDVLIVGQRDQREGSLIANGIGNVFYAKRHPRSLFNKLYGEITMRAPWFHSLVDYPSSINSREYDLIVASPLSMVTICANILCFERIPHRVALISDIYTTVLRSNSLNVRRGVSAIKGAVQILRSFIFPKIEARILRGFTSVLVQTSIDLKYGTKLLGFDFLSKAKVFTNGVSSEIFRSSPRCLGSNIKIIFIATFSDVKYRDNLFSYIKMVHRPLVKLFPSCTLVVVGKGLTGCNHFDKIMDTTPNICYTEYVENLEAVYAEASIAVAPIFKGYGFINKVAEAIAAGVPVVGDISAFNGIESIIETGGGHVANRWPEFLDRLCNLLDRPDLYHSSSRACIEFASEHLDWSSRKKVLSYLTE